MIDLPAWVLNLVHALDRAEDEHPELFRYVGPIGSRNDFEPLDQCPLQPLLELVPSDILTGVRLAARWSPPAAGDQP